MEYPVLELRCGKLRGMTGITQFGESYFKFHSIPYSNPPTRFQEGELPSPWEGIRDATEESDGCYSRCEETRKITGSEDCLHLNVFTKKLPDVHQKLAAVMVWFHGGAYTIGNSKTDLSGPDFLLTEDIVLVTVNYRLGILGFLNFEDSSLPAARNLGLKDQRLALKWIQKNIDRFGGDPNNVTIFGESSGASSCHYHILSEESKGLFHKAVLQSGSALSILGLGEINVIKIAETMGYKVNTEREAFDILSKVPVNDIHLAQEKNEKFTLPSQKRIVGPMIEPKGSKSPIISKSAKDIIQNGQYMDIPIIIGFNADEALIIGSDYLLPLMKEWEFENFLPYHMTIDRKSELAKRLGQQIKEEYLGNGKDIKAGVQRLITDSYFIVWILASIKQHAMTSKQPVFAYKMTIDTKLNYSKQRGKVKEPGCAHTDDIGYLFRTSKKPEIENGSIEDASWRKIVKLWTNFAKYGNPTPNKEELGIVWDPVETLDGMEIMNIGNEVKMERNSSRDIIKFWKGILDECSNTYNLL